MAIEARLEQLGQRHQELDLAITGEMRHADFDNLRVMELKRRKLRIKEEMEALRARRQRR